MGLAKDSPRTTKPGLMPAKYRVREIINADVSKIQKIMHNEAGVVFKVTHFIYHSLQLQVVRKNSSLHSQKR